MSVKGFRLEDQSVVRYDYRFLDNIITDPSLTIYGAAADAKAVGDRLNALAHVPTSDNANLANESLIARSIDVNNIDLTNASPNSPLMEYISNILITPEKIKEQISKVDEIDLNSAFVNYLQSNLIVANAVSAMRANIADLSTTSLRANSAEIADLATTSLTAQSIDANNINADNLTADSAFVNALNAKLIVANAINAQTADIARIATQSLTAQSIDANNINTDNLTADSAFIKYLESNLITSARIDVNDLKAKLADVDNLRADSAFVGYLSSLTANVARQTVDTQYVTTIVAENMTLSELQAGDIVLSNNMRILSKDDATEGMIMSGSELQFLDGEGNVSISIGYNTVSDGQGGTTVDYDHPAIIIKDKDGQIMLNSQGLEETDIGLAPMIQDRSIDEGKLGFYFVKRPNGEIIVQNYDGSQNTWGTVLTEYLNDVNSQLGNRKPIDVDIYYLSGDSVYQIPEGEWSTTPPPWSLEKYVWQKTITTYDNQTIESSLPECIQDTNDEYSSIEEQYYKSTSYDSLIGGEWTTIKPSYDAGYYIWTRSKINWVDKEATYTTPVLATSDNDVYNRTINVINNIASQDTNGKWSLTQGVMSNTYVYMDEEHTQPIALASLGANITTTTEGIVASVERNVIELINTETDRRKALYGKCITESDVAAKEVDCDNFELYTGVTISVDFKYENTKESPTLNVEDTGAIPIRSYKNEILSQEEYSWDAGAVLDFVYDGRRWRLIDNGTTIRVASAESRIDMNADKISAMVSVDGETSSITLTQNMLEAITEQFVVKSPDGSATIISGGLLSTDAIKSNNYVAPPGGPAPYSIAGTFLNLANGNIYTPNFAVDNVNKHAYLNGTIHTKAGEIGGFTITENSIYNNMTSIDDEVDEEEIPLGEGIYLEAQDYYVLDEDDYLTTNFRPVLYGVYIGTDGIALGKGKFKVDAFGNMYANSATIVGDITATSLHIDNGAIVDGVVTPNELEKVKAVYGTCNTAAADQEKIVVLNNFDYYPGTIITVGFAYGNTNLSPTLNVNQKGAKPVKSYLNANLTEADSRWPEGASIIFIYDGTSWVMHDAGVFRVNDLVNDIQDIVTVHDERNDVARSPQWYVTNYPKRRIMEFKTTTSLGLTGDTYCWLETDIPWTDSTGGWPKQTVEVNGKQYWRQGVDANTWSAWIDSYGTALESAKTANNFIAADNTGIMVYDGTASTKTSSTVTTGNVLVTSNGMKVRNGQLVLAEYGDSIKIYKPGTQTAVVDISQNGATFTGGIVASSLSILPSAVISGVATSDELGAVSAVANAAATNTDLTNEVNQRKAKYGTSNTIATDAIKNVTCNNFELIAGNELTVKFSTANTSSGKIQLNVNTKGAVDVWVANAVTSSTNKLLWGSGAYITFRYDGTQFIVIGEPRIWYGESNAAATANTKSDNVTQAVGCVICKGTIVNLAMTYENTATAPTLNIQSTGDLPIYAGNGTTRPLANNGLSWSSGTSQDFIFDGVQWRTSDSGSAARAKFQADESAKVAVNFIAEGTDGIMVYNGVSGTRTTTNVATGNALITSTGMKVRYGTTVLADYGSAINIYNPNTGESAVTINSEGATFTGHIVASSLTIEEDADVEGLDIDLSGYATTEDLNGYATTGALNNLSGRVSSTEEIINYATKITANNGIWVTPTNKKPTSAGEVVTGVTTGTKIDGTGVGIYSNGSLKATYGDAINLYDPSGNVVVNINQDGATFTGNIVASHLTIEDPSEIEALIDPDSINVKTGIYVSCSTNGADQDKELTISNFSYYQGVTITVGFTDANTHATPRFKINSGNAVAIKGYTGANLAEAEYRWAAGAAITFVYDGSNWRMQDSGAQQAKASAASSANQASGSASQASSYASNASSSASSASSSASSASSSASSASSSASSASSSASSASSSATSANNAKEAAESARDVALETVTIKDTRSDNQNPQWYITNYPKRRVMEFKSTSVIGLSGDTYCWLQTDVPWSDSSGGWPKQLAEVNGKQYWRQGTSGTAWSAWIDASAVATNYITDITSDNGIWITPSDKKPNSNGEAVTTGSNATTGIHIDGTGMNVYKNGTSVAFYGDYARIGSDTGVAFNINSNSLEAYYINGTTRTRYFQVTPTSMTYGTAAVASQGYADDKANTAESNASYSVEIKISSIDYSNSQAVLVAIPYHKGSTTLPSGVSASFVWYKNAIGTAHGGTVSGTGNNTLTVTDLNASYIAVLQ